MSLPLKNDRIISRLRCNEFRKKQLSWDISQQGMITTPNNSPFSVIPLDSSAGENGLCEGLLTKVSA